MPGAPYHVTDCLARPRIVTHMSRPYSESEVKQISMLRQERWAILAECSAQPNMTRLDESRYSKLKKRLAQVHMELYKVTGNPIYNEG